MRRLPHRNSIQLSLGWICLFWLGLAVTGWCRVAAVICAPVLWPGGTGFSRIIELSRRSSALAYNPNDSGHSPGALGSITHTLGATQLARHLYGSDKGGRITSWQQESNGLASAITKYDYSMDDELLGAEDRNLSTSALIDNEKWGLDKAGNWLSHTRSATSLMETRTHDNLNRLNQIGGAGSTLVEGTVNELSTVTVNNQPAEFSTLSMRF